MVPLPELRMVFETRSMLPYRILINNPIFTSNKPYQSPLPVAEPQSITLSTFHDAPNLCLAWRNTAHIAA